MDTQAIADAARSRVSKYGPEKRQQLLDRAMGLIYDFNQTQNSNKKGQVSNMFVCKDNECNCGTSFTKIQGLQRHLVVTRKQRLGIPVNMPESAFNALSPQERQKLSNEEKAKWDHRASDPNRAKALEARRVIERARYAARKAQQGGITRTPEAAIRHAEYMKRYRQAKQGNKQAAPAPALQATSETATERYLRLHKELELARQDLFAEQQRLIESSRIIGDLLNPPVEKTTLGEHLDSVDRASRNAILSSAQFGNAAEH